MQLRPYQIDAKNKVFEAFKQYKNVLLQTPTGGGKTVIFSDIAKEFHKRGNRVMVLVHRKELIKQAVEKLLKFGIKSAIIQPEFEYKPSELMQVASVQTLIRRKMPLDVKLIITDEAHHSLASSYQKIYENYPEAYHLGVTATPIRTTGQGFKDTFDVLIQGKSVRELVEQGYLVSPKIYANPLKFDLNTVKKTAGDYNEKALYEAFEKNFTYGNLVKTWQEKALNKRTVVFAINVEHSQHIVETYQNAGIPAEHVDGKTPANERDSILKRFTEGKTLILSNVGIVTEGFDVPAIECVQLVRPTKSLALYLQMVGRGLRPATGKEKAVILDHSNCVFEHGFPEEEREWSLDGVKIKEKNKLKQMFVKLPGEGKIFDENDIRTGKLPEHIDDIELIEVDLQSQSIVDMRKFISIANNRNYKKGYAWYRFLDKHPQPSETDILMFAQMANYKKGWIKYKFDEFGYSL